MKIEKMEIAEMNAERSMGFVKIADLEHAQQVTVNIKTLMHIGRLSEVFEKLGFEHITLTVENDQPFVVGGSNVGIGIAGIVLGDR